MAFYFALFNVSNANQELRGQLNQLHHHHHSHHRQQLLDSTASTASKRRLYRQNNKTIRRHSLAAFNQEAAQSRRRSCSPVGNGSIELGVGGDVDHYDHRELTAAMKKMGAVRARGSADAVLMKQSTIATTATAITTVTPSVKVNASPSTVSTFIMDEEEENIATTTNSNVRNKLMKAQQQQQLQKRRAEGGCNSKILRRMTSPQVMYPTDNHLLHPHHANFSPHFQRGGSSKSRQQHRHSEGSSEREKRTEIGNGVSKRVTFLANQSEVGGKDLLSGDECRVAAAASRRREYEMECTGQGKKGRRRLSFDFLDQANLDAWNTKAVLLPPPHASATSNRRRCRIEECHLTYLPLSFPQPNDTVGKAAPTCRRVRRSESSCAQQQQQPNWPLQLGAHQPQARHSFQHDEINNNNKLTVGNSWTAGTGKANLKEHKKPTITVRRAASAASDCRRKHSAAAEDKGMHPAGEPPLSKARTNGPARMVMMANTSPLLARLAPPTSRQNWCAGGGGGKILRRSSDISHSAARRGNRGGEGEVESKKEPSQKDGGRSKKSSNCAKLFRRASMGVARQLSAIPRAVLAVGAPSQAAFPLLRGQRHRATPTAVTTPNEARRGGSNNLNNKEENGTMIKEK